MNLATATVTVYFVGLMNFHTPRSTMPPNPVKREVIVPIATSMDEEHAGVKLEPHDAYIVIRGLSESSDCKLLDGTLNSTATECKIGPITSGKTIILPAPAVKGYTVSTRHLPPPAMTGQCPDVTLDPTYLTEKSKYAVRVNITDGFLGACTSQFALIPRLTFESSSGQLSIDAETVKLKPGAAIYIINSPSHTAGQLVDERQHFYWYYKMFKPPAGKTCTGWPKVSHLGDPCDPKIPHLHNRRSQSGASCTPTGWP